MLKWVHPPTGTELEGHRGEYEPAVVGMQPYRADGKPAAICAGFQAATRQFNEECKMASIADEILEIVYDELITVDMRQFRDTGFAGTNARQRIADLLEENPVRTMDRSEENGSDRIGADPDEQRAERKARESRTAR